MSYSLQLNENLDKLHYREVLSDLAYKLENGTKENGDLGEDVHDEVDEKINDSKV